MSKGAWKPGARSTRETQRLIAAAEKQGYVVTSIEKNSDGTVKLGVMRPDPGSTKPIETPEDLRAQL